MREDIELYKGLEQMLEDLVRDPPEYHIGSLVLEIIKRVCRFQHRQDVEWLGNVAVKIYAAYDSSTDYWSISEANWQAFKNLEIEWEDEMEFQATDDIDSKIDGVLLAILRRFEATLSESFDATENIEAKAYGEAIRDIRLLFR